MLVLENMDICERSLIDRFEFLKTENKELNKMYIIQK